MQKDNFKDFENSKMVIKVAHLTCEKFIDIYENNNKGSRIKITQDEEWIREHGTNEADLAKLEYGFLPDDYRFERYTGAKVAWDLVIARAKEGKPLDAEFIEYASDLVHEDWLSRNKHKAEAEHLLKYAELSEKAKDKDRIFVQAAIEVFQNN